ncbi:MAG: dUTP diphosphatase [Knoellia sp.]
MTGPSRIPVAFRRLSPKARIPAYASDGDAGADLTSVAAVTLAPGERALVPTGLAIALPPGTVGLVHPRSGLAARHGITVANAPGTVDSGYRGEIFVNLINLDRRESFTIAVGDRIAQIVVQEYLHADFTETDSLPDSVRGDTGHGSTGGFGSTPPHTLEEVTTP